MPPNTMVAAGSHLHARLRFAFASFAVWQATESSLEHSASPSGNSGHQARLHRPAAVVSPGVRRQLLLAGAIVAWGVLPGEPRCVLLELLAFLATTLRAAEECMRGGGNCCFASCVVWPAMSHQSHTALQRQRAPPPPMFSPPSLTPSRDVCRPVLGSVCGSLRCLRLRVV